MGKCDFCGQEIDLPFTCPFCHGNFCIEHRLPENHSCINAPPRTPLGPWKAKKAQIVRIEKPTPKPMPQEPSEISVPIEAKWKTKNQCPKCSSTHTMCTAYRERFITFKCLNCGSKWKQPRDHLFLQKEEKLKIRMPKLKIHAFGLIAGALALISLILPWWYFQMSSTVLGISVSLSVTADLNKVMISGIALETTYAAESTSMSMWFAHIALDLILVGGILAIVGGLISGKIGKSTLILAGILILLSIIVYAYGLQKELPRLTDELINSYNFKDFPQIQLFSSGAYSHPNLSVPSWNYSSYLYLGFWVDLIATILAFISAARHV